MVRLRRRDLMVGGAAAAASTLLRPGQALGFGDAPIGGVMLPEELRVSSILEFYLFGGVSQYESFYAVPAHGNDAQNPAGWHLHLQSGALDLALTECNFTGELLLEFGADSEGETVFLGPYADALRQRDDLLERMRILNMSHGALPHEVAIPLALSGRPLGHPRMAGLGAHIQRHFQGRDGGNLPVSYVLQSGSEIVSELGAPAYATGVHPAPARPLRLVVDQAAQLYELLDRATVGNRTGQHDALVAANFERYRQRLVFPGSADPVRATHFGEALASSTSVALAQDLRALLSPEFLEPIPGQSCSASTPVDVTTMSVRLAARLIDSGARYVCVLANGMVETQQAGGFDTHQNDCPYQARNVMHALRSLTDIIKGGPTPPPGQPMIDLDKTLVIINTEFGRTPYGEGSQGGRGHWPYSYPVIMLGGPMRRAIYGATDPMFNATSSLSPVHHRIAALLALGIWPFEDESFNVSDVEGAGSENDASQFILDRVFAV